MHEKRWRERQSEKAARVLGLLMAANSVSSFYKAIRVKWEQMSTCATCLWLLNNLSVIVLEDILVHMLYNGVCYGLMLLLNP